MLKELWDVEGTIWEEAGGTGEGQVPGAGILDANLGAGLMRLFQKNTGPVAKAAPAEKKSKKGQVTTLVDGKRALKGGILLAAFKDHSQVRDALLVGDSEFLSLVRVEALLEIVPTEQELKKVASYQLEDGERLAECERYFIAVREVPRIEQRLQILRMRHTFSSAIQSLRGDIKQYHAACEQVLNSKQFRRVLEVALELGNTFNGQKASGTRLSSLLEFLTMKASGDSRITLLHYLCSVLKTKMPELYDFHKQLTSLSKTPKKQNEIEIELRDISAQIMLANHELSNNAALVEDSSDTFYANMSEFCKEAAEKSEEMEEEFNNMVYTSQVSSLYLGENNVSMDKIFEMLSKFIGSYIAAQQEHTRLIKPDMVGPGQVVDVGDSLAKEKENSPEVGKAKEADS